MARVKLALSRKISLQVPDNVLEHDLLGFKRQALELGANVAEVIEAGWVDVDERVRLKCSIRLHPHYNQCLFCPPNTPPVDFVRNVVSQYSRALLLAMEVTPTGEFSDCSTEKEAVAK
jgi:predicted metal-binding protein